MSKIKELKDYVNQLDEMDEVGDPGDVINKLCGMISKLPDESPNPEQGIEAVEFARWITENDGEILDKDHWRFRNNTTHSTEHLYKIYKSV